MVLFDVKQATKPYINPSHVSRASSHRTGSPKPKTESIPLFPWKVAAYLGPSQLPKRSPSADSRRVVARYLADAEHPRSRAEGVLKVNRHMLTRVEPEAVDRILVDIAVDPVDQSV